MKKIQLLLLAVVAVLVTACGGGTASMDKLAEKIQSGEQLTQSEYGEIIKYCGDFASKAQVVQDKIDNLPTDSPEVTALNTQLNSIKSQFPLANDFFGALAKATPEQVGEENVKKVDELATMTWFDAPAWASITTDPGTAGFIEETPASDSSQVVAAPELVDSVVSK